MVHLGQRLQQERLKKNLTLDEVATATRIRKQFLQAIETGEYKKLPSRAYIQGFVKNYIDFLELPSSELMALFRREFNEKEFLHVLPQSFTTGEEIKVRRLHFHHPLVIALGIFLLLASYLFFQYKDAFFAPHITLSAPLEKQVLQTTSFTVSGTTDTTNTLTINNQPVLIQADGTFTKQLNLFPGPNVVTITAINTFGKKTVIERHITITSS